MNKFRSLVAVPLVVLASFSIAACGGDDEAADLDPTEVLERTFSGDHDLSSGVFGATLDLEVSGEGGGNGSLGITAPFNDNGEGEVPDADLAVDLSFEGGGESIDVSGGGAITPEGATVNFNDTDYAVPDGTFREFSEGFVESREDSESTDLPFDPMSWFTNVTNEGTEDIDGTETVRVSGEADATKIAEDLIAAVGELGIPGAELPEGFDASQLSLLEGFIEEATFDVYSQTDDYLLRQLDVTLRLQNLAAVSGSEGPDTASFELSLTMSEPNIEQEISLPTDTEPFDQLEADLESEFGELLGLGDLGDLPGDGGSGGSGGSGGAGGVPGGASGGGGDVSDREDVPGVDQDFLDCIENAPGPEALNECAEKAGP